MGDMPMSFPQTSLNKAEGSKKAGVLQHLLVGAISGGVSRSAAGSGR
jgi:hypothetical protein